MHAPESAPDDLEKDASRTLAAAREHEANAQRYGCLFEYNPDAVYSFDLSGNFTSANRAAEDLCGFSRDELLGTSFARLVVPEQGRRAMALFQRAAEGVPQYFDLTIRHRDGHRVELRGAKLPIVVRGEVEGVFGIASDVTTRRATEHALAHSMEMFATSFRASPNASAIIRWADELIIDANPTWCETLGLPRDAVVGRSLTELEAWADPADRERFLDEMERRGRAHELPMRLRKGEAGLIRLARISAESIVVQGERCMLVTWHDETAQRTLESQLRQSQKMEALGQLAGGIAHDFNNLLTVIQSSAELALTGVGTVDNTREDLEAIMSACRRAAALTGQLLAFSRTRAVGGGPIELNDVIGHTSDMLRRLLATGVSLDVALGVPLLIDCERGQVEQVLVNLVVNARDAMPDGGTVTIETAEECLTDDDETMFARGAPCGIYARITVSDTGVGMLPEVVSRVCEPFFTTKPVGQGTGLGMATVYGIVNGSGGVLRIESEPGRGTRVHVLLPGTRPPVASSASSAVGSAR